MAFLFKETKISAAEYEWYTFNSRPISEEAFIEAVGAQLWAQCVSECVDASNPLGEQFMQSMVDGHSIVYASIGNIDYVFTDESGRQAKINTAIEDAKSMAADPKMANKDYSPVFSSQPVLIEVSI